MGTQLVVWESPKEMNKIKRSVPMFNKKLFGPNFRQVAKGIKDTVEAFDQAWLKCLPKELKTKGFVMPKFVLILRLGCLAYSIEETLI